MALTVGNPATGTTANANNHFTGCVTSDIFGTYVYGNGAADQVWTLTLPQDSGVNVDVDATFDSAIYLMSGANCQTATAHQNTACQDSLFTAGVERLQVAWLPAGTYYVVVDGYWDGMAASTQGTYTITATLSPGGICPVDVVDQNGQGNALETAYPVAATFRDQSGQPQDLILSLCNADEDWFSFFNSGGDVSVRAGALAGSGGTTTMVDLYSVMRDSAGTPTGSAVTNGVAFSNGVLTASALAPGEYAAHVTATGNTEYGLNIFWSCEPDASEGPRGNNLATQATGPFNTNASTRTQMGLCPGDVDHVWFRSQAGGTVTLTVNGGGLTVAALDATTTVLSGGQLAIQSVTPSSTATVTNQGANRTVTWQAQPNASLVLRISAANVPAAGVFYEVAAVPPPPANDLCSNAQMVTLPAVGSMPLRIVGNTAAATSATQESTALCVGVSRPQNAAQPDVFYRFTTGANPVRLRASTEDPVYDSVLYVRTGCSGGAMELACNDDRVAQPPPGIGNTTSLLEVDLAANTPYVLVVDSWDAGGPFVLVLETL